MKVDQIYSGTNETERYEDMVACDQDGRLMVHTTKQYPTEDTTCFHVLGRVMSGTLHSGQEVEDFERVWGKNMIQKDFPNFATVKIGCLLLIIICKM